MNGLKRYLFVQIFHIATLVYIMSQIFPARPGTIDAERREAMGLMPGSHPGMDAISAIALVSGILSLFLYKEIKWWIRILVALIWFLLFFISNPVVR